ncbi:hypothetical protein UFOVP707_45 [uncultured Caudovirales phage]|uniref:Uncharacterized protein n=1 Tax=uncultured Caudovirales phage TaxID=2100421 RepID=A0A6J5NNS3_9CAUD|nr:hypothetical protein UFOVP707_45 [uncultured Caudovirales phage]
MIQWMGGADEEQYTAAGLTPGTEQSWLQLMKQRRAIPQWVNSRDDLEAQQGGWERRDGVWVQASTNNDAFRTAREAMLNQMKQRQGDYFKAGMPTDQYEAGYQRWQADVNSAEQRLLGSMKIQANATNWNDLGFNRRRNGELFERQLDLLATQSAPGGFSDFSRMNTPDFARGLDDYQMWAADGGKAKYGAQDLQRFRELVTAPRAPTTPSPASVSPPTPQTAPTTPAAPSITSQQPGFSPNGTLQTAYSRKGLLGGALNRPG